jgi:hypothetical protein
LEALVQRILALVAVIIVGATFAIYRMHRTAGDWMADSGIYLAMTLRDRGMSESDAWDAARRFMRSTELGRETPKLFSAHPPHFYDEQRTLFANRPLYPALAALLPLRAPLALKTLSTLAYAFVPLALFTILVAFAPPWLAAFGAIAVALIPAVRDPAGIALTDELALLSWIAAFGALLAYFRQPGVTSLVMLVAATAALSFTRPAVYLPFVAALGVLVFAREPTVKRSALHAVAAIMIVALSFAVYTSTVHAAGVVSELRWDYAWQQAVHGPYADTSFAAWSMRSFRDAAVVSLFSLLFNLGPIALLLAAFGIVRAWAIPLGPQAAGALLAAAISIVANPFASAADRTVTLPAVPIALALAVYAISAWAFPTYAAAAKPRYGAYAWIVPPYSPT